MKTLSRFFATSLLTTLLVLLILVLFGKKERVAQ